MINYKNLIHITHVTYIITSYSTSKQYCFKINVEQLLDRLLNWGIEVGKDILAAIIIYIVGRFIIKQISRLVSKILEKRKLEISVQTFLKSLLSILLNLILAFAIISKLGVETTSFAAILASAGVAIGMALSGNCLTSPED